MLLLRTFTAKYTYEDRAELEGENEQGKSGLEFRMIVCELKKEHNQ